MVLNRCAMAIVVRPCHQDRERRLDLRLDLAVDRARRLVEHEQRRIGGDRPRERQQLPLADADRRAPLAEHLLVAARQPRGSRGPRPRAPPPPSPRLVEIGASRVGCSSRTSPAKRKMSCCT